MQTTDAPFKTVMFRKKLGRYDSPSIFLEGICGYHYTKEDYEEYTRRLTSYGFTCLRSEPDEEKQYSEMWMLSDLLLAKGELDTLLQKFSGRSVRYRLDQAIAFLIKNVKFGSLDVSLQKMALPYESGE